MKERLTLSRAQMAYRRRESSEAEAVALQGQIENYERTIQQLKDRRLEIADRIRGLDARMIETERELRDKGGKEFQELRERIDDLRIKVAKAEDRAAQALQSAQEAEDGVVNKRAEREELLRSAEAIAQERKGASDRLKEVDGQLGSATRSWRPSRPS